MKRQDIKKRPLSDTVLESLEPEDKEYRELDGNGLYFRVQPNGKKAWLFRYKKENGKWSWLGLGTYPTIKGALARKKANEFADKLSNGEPLTTRKMVNQQKIENENLRFKVLMFDWLDTKKSNWGFDTYDKAVKSIKRHIIPEFGERDFTAISPKEWFDFFQGLQRDLGIYTQVEKLTSYVRNAYDWAKFQEKIVFNPLEGITRHLDKNNGGNMKFVEINEFPSLIHAIRRYPKRDMAIGLELFALLFPRPVELRYATWEQFDFDQAVWIKPAEIMKKDIAHAVPLPKQAIKLLKELETYRTESNLLFAGRGSLTEPVSDNTFNQALNRLGYQGRQNPHGFRHIASTQLNNKFSDKEQVVEACLAHLKKGVKGVYDKGAHFEERIGMMQWWADEIDRMTNTP
ncbi:integrase [Acinetobacter defluvii]|uniref:Tyrosine-type recombinase/integrase n=1 Tax=Acinetobacter defluvii TaxID=1871111 RepID=A0A2S2FE31_9GAMM|nr:tyrosine-type recombinase/integrase [Acinetobacter defluvii]AWL29226.1 tyrosine-type recombinase/integrase [Acinetobacter defluvii]NNP72678.1 integrase [Acinetobacter defluvii]